MKVNIVKEMDSIRQAKRIKNFTIPTDWMVEGTKIIGSDIYTPDKVLYKKMEEEVETKYYSWWEEQECFSVKNVYPDRYRAQVEFLNEKFVPYLSPDDIICDIASATGEFSFMISNKVKQIDGYELSANMVQFAKEQAKKSNITNVNFYQKDMSKSKLDKKYDAVMMMGLLTYIMDDELAKQIIGNVAESMKSGGKMIVKDSTTSEPQNLYSLNVYNRYQGCYRTKENYLQMFEQAGLHLVEMIELQTVKEIFVSIGAIFVKR